jgi:dTDP-4-dehydrorhamnose reductase
LQEIGIPSVPGDQIGSPTYAADLAQAHDTYWTA